MKKRFKRVIIESPYAGDTKESIKENVEYARACLLDSLERGEAPIASHLLYTQVLNDAIPSDRELGIGAGLAWRIVASYVVFYVDRGWSRGMIEARELYRKERLTYLVRSGIEY